MTETFCLVGLGKTWRVMFEINLNRRNIKTWNESTRLNMRKKEWDFSKTAMNRSVPYKPKNVLTRVQIGYEVCPASYSLRSGDSVLGYKQAGVRKWPLIPLDSVEARNEWSHTYNPLHTFMACTGKVTLSANINFSNWLSIKKINGSRFGRTVSSSITRASLKRTVYKATAE